MESEFTIRERQILDVLYQLGNATANEVVEAIPVELANATVPQMRTILDAGGSRFRIANPSTWAKQAALAAENNWTELKKLQTALSGGVKK